jgi:hypothetical protein
MALMIPLEEATKIVADAMTEAYERGRQIGEAERKVIEAAKAWLERRDGPSDEALRQAMEALLAAEGES